MRAFVKAIRWQSSLAADEEKRLRETQTTFKTLAPDDSNQKFVVNLILYAACGHTQQP